MRFTNPGQFEKMRRLEGFRRAEDIWDIETYNDIKNEVKKSSLNIYEYIEEHELTQEAKYCLDKTRSFCVDSSENFRKTFLKLLEDYRNNRYKMSQKIVDYLKEKRFDLPTFTIANSKKAKDLLESYGFNEKIDKDSVLLVFQLPKPLSQFWWKGGADSWGERAVDVQDTVIEWGHFYRELMPIIWEEQACYENEEGLSFYRVNDIGDHDSKKYYYIWIISQWSD